MLPTKLCYHISFIHAKSTSGRQGSTEHMVVRMFRLVTDNGVNQILSMQFWALVSCLTQT